MAIKDLPSSILALLSSKIYFQFSSHTSYFKTCQIMLLLCSQLGNGSHNTQKKFFSVTYKALHYQVSITSLTSYSMDLPPNHSSVLSCFSRCSLNSPDMILFYSLWLLSVFLYETTFKSSF